MVEGMELSKEFAARLKRVMTYRRITVKELGQKMEVKDVVLILHLLNGCSSTIKKRCLKSCVRFWMWTRII